MESHLARGASDGQPPVLLLHEGDRWRALEGGPELTPFNLRLCASSTHNTSVQPSRRARWRV